MTFWGLPSEIFLAPPEKNLDAGAASGFRNFGYKISLAVYGSDKF